MNQKEWRNHIPNLHNGAYRRMWDKAMARKSMRAAVTAKCQDCCCWNKAEIKDCLVPNCPLYAYRPYQDKESGAVATPQVACTEINASIPVQSHANPKIKATDRQG